MNRSKEVYPCGGKLNADKRQPLSYLGAVVVFGLEQLQKQLELVTPRLPAPKGGFWSRLLASEKKEEQS